MGLLINIDNGGTLTDVFVSDGIVTHTTKTLTTPFDLSKCFFDGLTKVSKTLYGREDLAQLLAETDHIRYSTTQGTNALIERKGPRIGLLLSGDLTAVALRSAGDDNLFTALIDGRHEEVDLSLDGAEFETAVIRTVNGLVSAGANRLVVAHGGLDNAEQETRIKRILLRRFPPHLLGAVPILYSHELAVDHNDRRRTWSAVFNAFLHPAMEHFLYAAEHQLRASRGRNPLLIFRNDGDSARVAKTTAIKTYSSGPRGGLEGAKVLASSYGFGHVLTVDVGGTTTDIGEIRDGRVRAHRRGCIEGVDVSLPLSDLTSAGVGGSSIIRAESGRIEVGPLSVGSIPGPACFGLGGTSATITDAYALTGLLDPQSYFGGELHLDAERARAAIRRHIAQPLGLSEEAAAAAMETAWVDKIAKAVTEFSSVGDDTTLIAFGGAGPLVITKVADAIGLRRVLIPGLAAVFSAYGLSFSDISHEYHSQLGAVGTVNAADAQQALHKLAEQARRGMRAEGFDVADCSTAVTLQLADDGAETDAPFTGTLPSDLPPGAALSLSLVVTKPIPHPPTPTANVGTANHHAMTASGVRRLDTGSGGVDLPLHIVEDQSEGASGTGPAVLEQRFFTCRVDEGWDFVLTHNGDILLTRSRP